MNSQRMTAAEGAAAMTACLLVTVAISGLFYFFSVALFQPDTTARSLHLPSDSSPEQIKARTEAWETAELHRRSEAEDEQNVWLSAPVLSRAGAGACIGLVVSLIGILIWRFGDI